MTHVTLSRIGDRETAVSGVLDAWIRALRAFSAAGVYPVETGIAGVRLDRAAYAMLRELAQHGPRRLGDLARVSNLAVSHASRLVEGMVRHGLIVRTTPAGDRRVTILDVSTDGRQVSRRVEQRFAGLIADRLVRFEEHEVVDFARHLQRFADEMDAWSRAEIPERSREAASNP